MGFHARCERCGKYELAGSYGYGPALPEKWNCLVMDEMAPNVAPRRRFVLCSSCSGDIWGGIEAQMKFRAEAPR